MAQYKQAALFKCAPKTKPVRGDGRTEHQHQARLITWARDSARLQTDPALRDALIWLHSVPNGSYVHRVGSEFKDGKKKAPRQALKLIDEGLTSGVWDLRLDYVQRTDDGSIVCPGLIIEMKMPTRYLSEKQKEYQAFMISQGYATAFCRNWMEAAKAIVDFLRLEKYEVIYQYK